MTNIKTDNIKWYYYEIHNIVKTSKSVNIVLINIMMFVAFIFMYNPYLSENIILVSHKIVSSQGKKSENVHY